MGMFSMAQTTGLKESGNFLSAGIHKAKFNGLSLGSITSQKDGREYNVMTLTLDVDGHGDFTHNFFEPTSAERTASQFGENPSQVEQFLVSLRQIFDALDSKIGEAIDNKNVVINGKQVNTDNLDFSQLVKLASILTKPYIGTEVEIKLIPQSSGFNALPGFPAKINRAGALGIATRFIGHNLTLSQSEQKRIEQAQNTRPTNMATNSDVSLDGIADTLGVNTAGSDLPF